MMSKCTKFKGLKYLLIFTLILTFIMPSYISFAQYEIMEAPLNPEFERYLEEINNPKFEPYGSKDSRNGLIPDPFIIERDTNFIPSQLRDIDFPSKYDLREINRVTPVKDQGKNGSCWAFAAYGSLESWLMLDREWDFSENHMKNTHGFEWEHDSGGNRTMSTAYLTRGDGPVLEEDDPYNEFNGTSPEGLSNVKQVKNVLYLPDRVNATDNDYIKWALMEYGAVQSSYYDNDKYRNEDTNSYYCNKEDQGSTNHAIAIVGWDDDYDKTKFNIEAPENGAFIIKNSWGEGFGQEGYFYISYYDVKIGTNNAVYIDAVNPGYYDNVYQYDPLGNTGGMGFGNQVNWFANVFNTKEKDEELTAVSFYTIYENLEYEIWIDTDLQNKDIRNEDFRDLKKVKEGNIEIPGYHTIEFEPEIIEAGKKFIVAVKIIDSQKRPTIPLENPSPGYSNATANEGESYIGFEMGNTSEWYELTAYRQENKLIFKNSNVNLKAFTRNLYLDPEGLELDYEKITLLYNQSKKLSANVLPEEATNKNVIWSTEDKSIATVDDGLVTARGVGKTNIIATTIDGNHSAICQVEVTKYPVSIENVDFTEEGISIDLTKASDDLTGLVIIQPYDINNRPMRVLFSNTEILKDKYNFTLENSLISHVKVFVWDSIENMKPLAEWK